MLNPGQNINSSRQVLRSPHQTNYEFILTSPEGVFKVPDAAVLAAAHPAPDGVVIVDLDPEA